MTPHRRQRAVARLPGDQRIAVLLCDLWGFQYDEIADILGVPIGTVRSRIARARGRLLVHLSGETTAKRNQR